MTISKKTLELCHRLLARAAGRLSVMLARGAVSPSGVAEAAAEARRAVEEMER